MTAEDDFEVLNNLSAVDDQSVRFTLKADIRRRPQHLGFAPGGGLPNPCENFARSGRTALLGFP
jgi:hypothetical protein